MLRQSSEAQTENGDIVKQTEPEKDEQSEDTENNEA